MIKNKPTQMIVDEMIEIAGEIEAQYFNDRFGLKDNSIIKNLRDKMHRRADELVSRGLDLHTLGSYNEDFGYAIQML